MGNYIDINDDSKAGICLKIMKTWIPINFPNQNSSLNINFPNQDSSLKMIFVVKPFGQKIRFSHYNNKRISDLYDEIKCRTLYENFYLIHVLNDYDNFHLIYEGYISNDGRHILDDPDKTFDQEGIKPGDKIYIML